MHCKPLTEVEAKDLCDKVKEILIEEANVQLVDAPVSVCGDVHGQFFDVLELLRVGGQLPETSYIFLGDYVDRGFHSVETLQLLLCYKLKYPSRITLLRGNHECRQVTLTYGFYDECLRKYGSTNVWRYCTDVFDYMSLAAVIDCRILCVHGGLSPELPTLQDIQVLERTEEIPSVGPFCDLVWSDPSDSPRIEEWALNERGAGWVFGGKVTSVFNHINGIDLICRAHQIANEGYQYKFKDKNLVTVWSAPHYMYRCNNVAAILKFNENLDRQILIFREVQDRRRMNADTDYFL